MLKNILFGSLLTASMIALSGCAADNGNAGKCDSAKTVEKKCDSAKTATTTKCNSSKCDTGK